jgi:hypothetical protein
VATAISAMGIALHLGRGKARIGRLQLGRGQRLQALVMPAPSFISAPATTLDAEFGVTESGLCTGIDRQPIRGIQTLSTI